MMVAFAVFLSRTSSRVPSGVRNIAQNTEVELRSGTLSACKAGLPGVEVEGTSFGIASGIVVVLYAR